MFNLYVSVAASHLDIGGGDLLGLRKQIPLPFPKSKLGTRALL